MEENKTFMPPPPPMELRQNRTSQQETSHPVEGNDLSLQEEALNLQPFSEAENVEEDISEAVQPQQSVQNEKKIDVNKVINWVGLVLSAAALCVFLFLFFKI